MKLWIVEFIKLGFDLNRIKYRLSLKKNILDSACSLHYVLYTFFLN